jgi:hypothetical protein
VGFGRSEAKCVSKRQKIGVDGDRRGKTLIANLRNRGDDPITLSQRLQPAGYQSKVRVKRADRPGQGHHVNMKSLFWFVFLLDKAGKVCSLAAPHVTLELLQSLRSLASDQRPLTRCLIESVVHDPARSGRCDIHGHQVPVPLKLERAFGLRRPCQRTLEAHHDWQASPMVRQSATPFSGRENQ